MSQELPNARVEIVPEAGHSAHTDNPAAFLELARRFPRRRRSPEHDAAFRRRSGTPYSTEDDMSAISWKTVKNYTDIRFEKCDDGIAKITIARPEVRNAFRPQDGDGIDRRIHVRARRFERRHRALYR